MYLETMEEVLSNTSKVMVDVEGGNNLLYLPLDKLMSQSNGSPTSSAAKRATNEVMQEHQDAGTDQMHRLDRVREQRDQRREQR